MTVNYEQCTETTKQTIIVLKEKRCSLTVNNPNQRDVDKIEVDGCLLANEIEKCDWLLTTELPSPKALFVELKGCDVNKAVSQLKSTIDKTQSKYDRYKKICRIVSTRSPLSSSEIQKRQVDMRRNYGAELKVETIKALVDLEVI